MKKFYKLFLVFVGILLFFMSVSSINHVYAKSSKANYIKCFPKELKGTWYTYTNFGFGKKRIYKKVINTRSMHFHTYKKHTVYTSNHLTKKQQKNFDMTSNWYYIRTFNINGNKWFNVTGWQQDLKDSNKGVSFNIHYFNGHKVLTMAEGSEHLVDTHFYKSKHLAKKMSQKRYNDFKYMVN